MQALSWSGPPVPLSKAQHLPLCIFLRSASSGRKTPPADAGTQLVRRVLQQMKAAGAEEIALEAETTNRGALAMYESLGFVRDKRLERCRHLTLLASGC